MIKNLSKNFNNKKVNKNKKKIFLHNNTVKKLMKNK